MTLPPPIPDDAQSLGSTVGRLRRDIARYVPGFVLPALVSAAYVYIFTRVFDPVEFGRYSMVAATANLLTVLLAGWMTQSILRYLPRYREEKRLDGFRGALGWLLLRFTAVVTLVLLVLFLVSVQRLGEYRAYVPAAIVMVATGLDFMVLRMVYQTELRSAAVTRFQIVYALGRIAASLAYVFYIERSAVGLIVGSAAPYLLLVPTMVVGLRMVPCMRLAREERPPLVGTFARYGFPMIGWIVGTKIMEVADRYVIELTRGSDEVGVYSASYNLVTMAMWLSASPVLSAANPLTMRSWESGDRNRIQELVSEFLRHYLLVGLPLVVLLCVVAGDIVAVFLGSQFDGGYVIIPLVAVAHLMLNCGFYGDKGLRLAERTGLVFGLVMMSAVSNVVLNILLVPSRGFYGAAIATLISASLYPVVVWVASRRVVPWRIPWRSVARIGVSSALGGVAAAVALRALPDASALWRLALGSAAVGLVYVGILWFSGELSDHEKGAARRLLGR